MKKFRDSLSGEPKISQRILIFSPDGHAHRCLVCGSKFFHCIEDKEADNKYIRLGCDECDGDDILSLEFKWLRAE